MRLDIPHALARLSAPTLLLLIAVGVTGCASPIGISPQALLRDALSLGLPAPAPVSPLAPTPSTHAVPASGDTPASTATWWQAFGDAQLNRLVDEALQNNPGFKLAQARVAKAQAVLAYTDANSAPQVAASMSATRQLYSAHGLVPAAMAGKVSDSGTLQVASSWEIDLFGRNRIALDAAIGNVRAIQADRDAARMLLASNVVRTYVQMARLNDQLSVANQTLAQRSQVLRLVQQRVNAGLDSALEQAQSQAALPEAQFQIEVLQEQITLLRHTLSALLGQPKVAPTLELPTLAGISTLAGINTLPADLLGRRPDIAAARWRVEAATQEMGSARLQFYPNINLVAFAGLSSIGLNNLLTTDSQQWGVTPAISLPLFQESRLRANLRGKTADVDAAIESYNAVLVDAVRDVAEQLTSIQAIQRQQVQQRAAQASTQLAYDFAKQRYEAGLSNYLSVLTAEVAVLTQRRQRVDLAARALETQVGLMRALGGGYQAELPVDQSALEIKSPTLAPL